MKKIYLATPYTHSDPLVRDSRAEVVNDVMAALMNQGFAVYSPITQTHELQKKHELPHTWDYWKDFDSAFLTTCDLMVVVAQDGWRESVGVTAEIDIAKAQNIPVFVLHPEQDTVTGGVPWSEYLTR